MEPTADSTPARRLDVSGLRCPLTWVRTRLALEGLETGEVLEVLLNPGEMLRNIPRNAAEAGHAVTAPEPLPDGRQLLRIVKRTEAP